MIEQPARVIATDSHGCAWLECRPSQSCGACARHQGCGAGLLGRAAGYRPLRAGNPIHASPGEWVIVGIEARMLWYGALWAYGLPLGALLTGAVAGEALVGSDIGSLAMGLTGLGLGFAGLRYRVRRGQEEPLGRPLILRRVLGDAMINSYL